jgi:hypothetical protein
MFLLIAFLIISPQIHFIDGKVGSTVAARGGPPAVHSKGIDDKEGVIDDKEETPGADEGENGGSTLDYEAIFSALDVISSAPMDVMGTPQRIGDLEFDVEVDEKIPEKGQKAPEVDVEDDVSIELTFDLRSHNECDNHLRRKTIRWEAMDRY